MPNWKIYTPEGVFDIMPDECYAKRNMEAGIREMLRRCGFYEIETPTVEFYDVFSADADMMPQETMFKFFDQQGRILALRPDMTMPVARMAATKCKDMPLPMRFFYIGNAFKYNEMGGGKQREFTEAGVEILGTGAPEADAEVIAAAINAARAAGLENFQVDIGQVEFFKGIMEESGLSPQSQEQMRILIDRKDYLGIEELAMEQDIPAQLKELILNLPGLFGSADVIEKACGITRNGRSQKALANLSDVLGILGDYGLEKYISVDLGMVQKLDYYTGIIFRGFTYGVGFPILSGGRYDSLVEMFGRKCPATGFSIGVNMVMTALERQKASFKKPPTDCLVCYDRKGRKTAFSLCETMRSQGMAMEMDVSGSGIDACRQLARSKGIGGVIFVRDENNIEVHDIGTGEIRRTTIKECMRMTNKDQL